MKKIWLIMFIILSLLGIFFTILIIFSKENLYIETVNNYKKFDLPISNYIENGASFSEIEKRNIPKGYQIIENEYGTFIYVYINDTFEKSVVEDYKTKNQVTTLKVIMQNIPEGNTQISTKWNFTEVFGIYQINEKPKNLIVKYYDLKQKKWIELEEYNYEIVW